MKTLLITRTQFRFELLFVHHTFRSMQIPTRRLRGNTNEGHGGQTGRFLRGTTALWYHCQRSMDVQMQGLQQLQLCSLQVHTK